MNKKINITTKYYKILKALVTCCFCFIVLFSVFGNIISPNLKFFYETAYEYDYVWTKIGPDGSKEFVEMPTRLHLKDGEEASFTSRLPYSVVSGTYLTIHTGKSFTMYVDGEEIYKFDNTIAGVPWRITKAVIVPVPLKKMYAGKELTIVFTNGKYERDTINTAYIGSMMGIVIILIKNYALQLCLALLLAIASLITIAIFAYLGKRDKTETPLIHLAEGIFAISVWIIFDSPVFQLVFNKYFFDGPASFMLVIMMGVPFLMYFDAISEYRFHKLYIIGESISVVNFIVLTPLHMTNILSYNRALIYADLMLLVYIIGMFVCTMRDFIVREDKSHKNVIIGLVGISLFSFLEIVVTILTANRPFKVDIGGLCVIIGMIILLVFAILDQVQILMSIKEESQNAIAATKAKSDFLANMSHEIRTPINAIMGMNDMILRESDQENVKEYAKDVSSASENLLRIVNDILDFSKIESGKLEIICDEYDLGEIIYEVTTLVTMKAEDKGLKLNISIDESLPAKLYGDDKRVREVITNILNNAVKYTEKGHVNLLIDGEIIGKTVNLNIIVADSGQGIRPEDIDKIFSGFSQVNVKKNKNIEGTGLGLSITKRLVELMDGSIEVESEYGVGSKFTVFLPQQIVSDEKMGNYLNHRHASSEKAGGAPKELEIPSSRILVVDDTPLNLKVISKYLSRTKANVTTASSGEEMLELIQNNPYDIIFLDHMMPNMDGIETLKALRKLENHKCKGVPIIALTANAIVGAKEMYLQAGFDDYLSKPISMDALCRMLEKYLL